jgi:hypothetical protein
MSIVIKNSQLNAETIEALNQLIEMDINAGSAFRLTRILKEISSIVEDKLKAEKRILEKYTEKDEDGNPTVAKDKDNNIIQGAVNLNNPDGFTKEMSELMDIDITINHDRINFDDLNLSTAKVKDLLRIDFLFN